MVYLFCAKYVINVFFFFMFCALDCAPSETCHWILWHLLLLTLLCFSWLIYPFCDYIISIIWIPLLWGSFSICDLWIPVCTETASIPWHTHFLYVTCCGLGALSLLNWVWPIATKEGGHWCLSLCNSIYLNVDVLLHFSLIFSPLIFVYYCIFSSPLFGDITITMDGRYSIELLPYTMMGLLL